MTVPLVVVPGQWEIMIPMAVDHWGDVCILAPWAEYKMRGVSDFWNNVSNDEALHESM